MQNILWYWNVVTEKNKKFLDDKNVDEIWTYNRFDAEKYNLNYNPQFYYYKKDDKEKNELPESDVIFMGWDKGREEALIKIKNSLEEHNLKCNFNIIHSINDFMDYDEYLKNVEKSNCILDFSFTIPCGLSLRPLEALFLHKKLITNNKDIVNYDFYNPDNILVIDRKNPVIDMNFFDKPYQMLASDLYEKYSLKNWILSVLS